MKSRSTGGMAALAATWIAELVPPGGRAEVAAAGVVVAIVVAMVLPVPVWLLDVLIALNICTASLMVVLVVQIKESVSLSTFPSLLLITTLFRLSLNVASTRLILLEGEAGHIIEAFGEVVVGGNLVVGLVVFLILTVIQFLVITKGSERVAEVGARFSLDAMPGKQLAVDMELKAGAITAAEAQLRRSRVSQESQFFGAMDGAMKFVKGDAIAGIIVTLTNLVGGLTIGVTQRDMSAAQAMHVYSILSIGDALVAQIPALLLSLTAGLLTTRVSNSDAGPRNIGHEMAAQLASQPKAWVIASGAMAMFGFLPGMPTATFAALGCGALIFGLTSVRRRIRQVGMTQNEQALHVPELREFSVVQPFVVRVAAQVTDPGVRQRLLNTARHVRNGLVERYGLVTPAIEAQFEAVLHDADFEFCQDEVRVFAMRVHEHLHVATCAPPLLASLQIEPPVVEPVGTSRLALQRVWVDEESARRLAEHVPVQDFWSHLESRYRAALLKAGPRHVNVDQTQRLLRWVAAAYPDLAKELERALPASRMAEVLQRLLGERVSIRNLSAICNALVEWAPRERDAGALTECVRAVLSREICAAYATGGELRAYVLQAEFEAQLRGAIRQTAYGDFLALPQQLIDAVLDDFADMLAADVLHPQPVIVCEQDLRPHMRRLIAERFPEVAVLAMPEVASHYGIRVLGVISLSPSLDDAAMGQE